MQGQSVRTLLIPTFALISLILVSGCDPFPKDPEQSLDNVMDRGVLRIGATASEPWVSQHANGEPGGLEGRLILDFAEELGVSAEVHWAGEEDLFNLLKNRELDVIIGGLTKSNPWAAHAGFTAPYFIDRQLVGVPTGRPMINTVENMPVTVLRNSGLKTPLEQQGAVVQEVEDLRNVQTPAGSSAWRLEGLGFEKTNIQIDKEDHVMAVPSGENALLMRLEEFLDAQPRNRLTDILQQEISE
ncbi:MAG TPA: transporter substrate-binding domain-containing protein [Pseudomonas xinjiangensis]|uniref:Transporter substrate-binding domain-containing protein n=2 Tax=root TaxID=1 RepID=A0A7V1FT60_9GAMM|nr:transporter substrate-binding domain-containing protein [Halopseudomonas xinjiangensis]HEC47442.1 transporter substrate-binding domain-containing protein [Halopseudomonas xinjiangensis]